MQFNTHHVVPFKLEPVDEASSVDIFTHVFEQRTNGLLATSVVGSGGVSAKHGSGSGGSGAVFNDPTRKFDTKHPEQLKRVVNANATAPISHSASTATMAIGSAAKSSNASDSKVRTVQSSSELSRMLFSITSGSPLAIKIVASVAARRRLVANIDGLIYSNLTGDNVRMKAWHSSSVMESISWKIRVSFSRA